MRARPRPGLVTHGQSRTPLYRIWVNMVYRCANPNAPKYRLYGGKGIRVCAAWQNSFERFAADVGRRPSPRHSIDRIDGNGHYEPGNVRWATPSQQNRNRAKYTRPRVSTKLSRATVLDIRRRRVAGETTVALGRRYRINSGTVSRIARGVSCSGMVG